MHDSRANPLRWQRIEALVDELLDLEPGKRQAALSRASATEPEIASEAQRLLAAMEEDDALGTSAAASFPDLVEGATEDAARDRSGNQLGPYRLDRVLGRGGMGVVYLAERADDEFEKRVAVKLMPRGLETEEMERRFRLERQVLARLEHPNIARLLDGGVTDEGYPYLVMELVEGEAIDIYCDGHALGLDERLRLFLGVCDGVQYAHQNLVIHRDLKPANILVTSDGSTKLLDFGVAKLTEDDPDATEPTRFQPRTESYASPEQLANQPVSTATDVYSLGVVLYRLIAGRRPQVGEERKPLLASRAAAGGTEHKPVPWSRRLVGDLDRILAKALAPEIEDRYATASAFAADLGRFLAGEPVTASEPTVAYRLRKFVSRHRVGFFASVAAAVALTTALAVALWQAERARTEAERSGRVAGLLSGLFIDADPWATTSGEVTVLDLIDRGVDRVRNELAGDPEIRLDLLHVLGQAYTGLGHADKAIPVLEEVVAGRRRLLGPTAPRTTESMIRLGDALRTAGRLEEARPLVEEAAASDEARHGRDSPATLDSLFALGKLRGANSDYAEQEALFRRIVAIRRAKENGPSSELALALGELSIALANLGRDEESLEVQRQGLEMAEETLGAGHPYTETLRNNMGLRLGEAGRHEEAVVYLRQALQAFENRPGIHETELVPPLSNVGSMLVRLGDFVAAQPYVERAAEIARRVSPPEDFARIGAEINLATLNRELGRLGEAETIYRSALERFEALLGAEHQATARARALLGMTLAQADAVEEGESALRAALAVQRDPERGPMSIDDTLLALGRLQVDRGDPAALEEAEAVLSEVLALRQAKFAAGRWQVAEVELELALLVQMGGSGRSDPEQQSAIRRALAEALPPDDFRLERAARLRADLH